MESVIIRRNGQRILISYNLVKTKANGRSIISALRELAWYKVTAPNFREYLLRRDFNDIKCV